jgi:hypothetical protein
MTGMVLESFISSFSIMLCNGELMLMVISDRNFFSICEKFLE